MDNTIHYMISVGIDVGTTTTQVVFSRLTLASGSGSAPPMIKTASNSIGAVLITDKEVIYRSDLHFTPLKDPDAIDILALEQILRREYQQAGITPEQVETGAVIITGETAKKRNADEILEALANLAGDFVVTVAGPHLESMIAGRGDGADTYSREHFTTVINVDIGGGSANSAIFRMGKMIAAAAMNFGGRILELDPTNGSVRRLAEPARVILAHLDLPLTVGSKPDLEQLRVVANAMAELTFDLIKGRSSPLAQKLMLTDPSPKTDKGTPLFFSGGIGHYIYAPRSLHTVSDVAVHGDIGPLLAESIRQHTALKDYDLRRPPETLQATVMGASSQTVTLSGSTIWAEEHILPIRNVPVLYPCWPQVKPTHQQVFEAITAALTRWDVGETESHFAIALELGWRLDYDALTEMARGLAEFADIHLAANQALVIIIAHDYARALGQTLKGLSPMRPLLVIDQVGLREGDYIDIGRPILDGRVVPLSIKTLIFYH